MFVNGAIRPMQAAVTKIITPSQPDKTKDIINRKNKTNKEIRE